jgi:two-component system, NtrC family, response regulator AtoC
MMGRLTEERLAYVKGTILITGESGTGKSYLARRIHKISDRNGLPFVSVNLATMTDDLLASELFGHVKGAFTGAHQTRIGYLEQVGAGTLFLDEIGELSPQMQKMLLLLLESGEYYPVGSTGKKIMIGRIIVATNRNLAELVTQGEFREDLYYRLRIFHYQLPPLRGQTNQIQALFMQFKQYYEQNYQKSDLSVSSNCMNMISTYHWPGNVRELKHCAEYLVAIADKKLAEIDDLPEWMELDENITIGNKISCEAPRQSMKTYRDSMDAFECELLLRTLNMNDGAVNKTARDLKISKSTLIGKIRRYGFNIWEMKSEAHMKKGSKRCYDLQQTG